MCDLLFDDGLLPLLVSVRPWVSQHGVTRHWSYKAHKLDVRLTFTAPPRRPAVSSCVLLLLPLGQTSMSDELRAGSLPRWHTPVGGHCRWPWGWDLPRPTEHRCRAALRGRRKETQTKFGPEFSPVVQPPSQTSGSTPQPYHCQSESLEFFFLVLCTGRLQEMCMYIVSELCFKVDWLRAPDHFCFCHIHSGTFSLGWENMFLAWNFLSTDTKASLISLYIT